MQFYELATLTVPVGETRAEQVPPMMQMVEGWLAEPGTGGRLLGSFLMEFGPQNKVMLLRGFDTRQALEAERSRVLMSANPFGIGHLLVGMELESYAQFPNLPPLVPAKLGPVYEFRTYVLKIGGLAPTLAAWATAIPGRTALSPLATVMYALDGAPRFTHVWAYRTFEERLAIRAKAFDTGVWPAPGAPEWLSTQMKTECYWPTPNSPLQ